MSLIIDTRERAVSIHKDKFAHIQYEIKQITYGDYVIIKDDEIKVVIERKTLDDYAASLKDGRHSNKKKLLSLRARAKCVIIYIIEGPLWPKSNQLFGGIPYYNIESSINHLVLDDRIGVLFTKDTLGTAEKIVNLVKSFNTIKGGKDISVAESLVSEPLVAESSSSSVVEILTEKLVKSDLDVVRTIWSCFRGITCNTADVFINRFCLLDILSGVTVGEIKTPSGRKISAKVTNFRITPEIEVRILAAIPGISRVTAKKLIEEHGCIKGIPSDHKKSQLITRFLTFKTGD